MESYVWGTYGNILTQSLLDYKVSQYPDGMGNYASFIQANYLGSRTTDCVGLIKGYGWLDTDDLSIGYAINGMPDYGANQMYSSATVSGPITTIPDTPGIAVWKSGQRSPSKPTIQSYQKALEQVISAKKDAISELEQDYLKVKDKLFEEATP